MGTETTEKSQGDRAAAEGISTRRHEDTKEKEQNFEKTSDRWNCGIGGCVGRDDFVYCRCVWAE
jgi:hypothetical protein